VCRVREGLRGEIPLLSLVRRSAAAEDRRVLPGASQQQRPSVARVAPSALENRQTGGGWVGGLLTCPCNSLSTKDGGAASTKCGSETVAGKIAPTKLKHLSAQVMEPLQSSGVQQGMSALSDIDISTGFVETVASPVAGTMATENAIRAAKTVRTISMRGNYRELPVGGQQAAALVIKR